MFSFIVNFYPVVVVIIVSGIDSIVSIKSAFITNFFPSNRVTNINFVSPEKVCIFYNFCYLLSTKKL